MPEIVVHEDQILHKKVLPRQLLLVDLLDVPEPQEVAPELHRLVVEEVLVEEVERVDVFPVWMVLALHHAPHRTESPSSRLHRCQR